MTSRKCGEANAFFYIEVQDGAPISFQCRATFRGPTLKLIEPVVDFGLLKINTTSKFRINIENTSPIPCEIMLKSFRYSHLSFDNLSQNKDSSRQI
jgi:hypothetical protein